MIKFVRPFQVVDGVNGIFDRLLRAGIIEKLTQ